jgi:SAM-dependent methyltransferase
VKRDWLRRALERVRRDHAAIFTRIYRENEWGSAESPSGPGSTLARAADFRDDLVALLRGLDTRVLLDVPCGDGNWIGPVADALPGYVGVDVVPALVEAARARNAAPGRSFVCADLTRDPLPAADVVLCRDCLVHFSFRDARAALANLRRGGAAWLVTTTFVDLPGNRDILTGGWRPLNLERPPFNLPPPRALVDERCTHSGGRYRDKRLGVWAMQDLPE